MTEWQKQFYRERRASLAMRWMRCLFALVLIFSSLCLISMKALAEHPMINQGNAAMAFDGVRMYRAPGIPSWLDPRNAPVFHDLPGLPWFSPEFPAQPPPFIPRTEGGPVPALSIEKHVLATGELWLRIRSEVGGMLQASMNGSPQGPWVDSGEIGTGGYGPEVIWFQPQVTHSSVLFRLKPGSVVDLEEGHNAPTLNISLE